MKRQYVFVLLALIIAIGGWQVANYIQVQGAGPAGSAVAGNPVLVAGQSSGGNATTLGVNSGAVQVGNAAGFTDGTSNNAFGLWYGTGASNFMGVAPLVFNGSTWDRPFYCANTATFNVASTITQVVALSGATKVRICSFSLNPSTVTAGSVDIVYGTGSNCASGTTTLTGAYTLPASAVVSITPGMAPTGPLITPAGQAVCIRTVTATAAGFLTWEQH